MTNRLLFAAGIAALLCGCAGTDRNKAHLVSVTENRIGFAGGDEIVIDEIVGSDPHLEAGGVYLLSGHYSLQSRPSARIVLFSTGTRNQVRTEGYKNIVVERGQGTFHMAFAVLGEGDLHVSMYEEEDE